MVIGLFSFRIMRHYKIKGEVIEKEQNKWNTLNFRKQNLK